MSNYVGREPKTELVEPSLPAMRLHQELISLMGDALSYQVFRHIGLSDDLLKYIDDLYEPKFNPITLQEEINKNCTESLLVFGKNRLNTRQASLRTSGNVLLPQNNGGTQYQRVQSEEKIHFLEILNSLDLPEHLSYFFDATKDEIESAEDKITQEIINKAKDVCELIPTARDILRTTDPESQLLHIVTIASTEKETGQPTMEIKVVVNDNHRDYKKIVRKTMVLVDLISAYSSSPEKVIAERFAESMQEHLADLAEEAVDTAIAEANYPLYQELLQSRKKPQSKRRATKEATKIMKDEPEIQERIIREDNSSEFHQLGEVKIAAPWMNDGEPVATELYEYKQTNNNSTYVLRAMNEQLLSISEASRDKSPTSSSEKNMYDQIVEKIAVRIANGILPSANSNSMIAVRKGLSKEFSKSKGVWYYFTKTPNAPRVYFTYADSLNELVSGDANFDQNKKCLVILAETDKANQISALKQITSKDHKSLRAGNAGSI